MWFANNLSCKLLSNHSTRPQTTSLFTAIHIPLYISSTWKTYKHWRLGAYYITDFPRKRVLPLHLNDKYQVWEIKMFVKYYLNQEVFVGVIVSHTRCHFVRCKTSPVNVSCHRVFQGSHISLRNDYCHKFVIIILHKYMYSLKNLFPFDVCLLMLHDDSLLPPTNWAGISKLSSYFDFLKCQSALQLCLL